MHRLLLGLVLLLAGCAEMDAPPADTGLLTMPEPVVMATAAAPVVQVGPVEGALSDEVLSDEALIAYGAGLYATNCAPCHRANGEGNLGEFPALNRNAFVTVRDPTAVIQTVLYGRQIMPAFAPVLTPLETAAVVSYVRNAWNNEAPTVSVEQVQAVQETQRTALSDADPR